MDKKDQTGDSRSADSVKKEQDGDYERIANPGPDSMDPPSSANQTSAPHSERPKQSVPDEWPIAADRVAIQNSLVESLRIMAGHYGRRTSAASLTAGLPVPKEGITPALFVRAAERADLHARLAERNLPSLAIAPNLPCILVLDNRQSCILWDVEWPKEKPGKAASKDPEGQAAQSARFIVQFPETEDTRQTLEYEALAAIYTGHAFFIRPVARADERAGPAEIDSARNWFWATLWENRSIYGEVCLAAVMINVFALASPIYIMNVYDKVIPVGAYDTLWVLTIGVLTVFVFDFILKNMRAHFLDFAGRRADVKISAMLFEQIMGMTMAARPASAGVLASNMKEFETLRDFFTSATMAALIDLPFVLFFIGIIALIGGPIAFVPLVAVPLVLLMGFAMQKPLQKVIRESMNESALKNALLFETITGLETIKVQAAEGHTQRSWEELTDKASRTSVKARRLSALALNWAVLVQQVASVFVVIVGAYLIGEGLLMVGALIACVILTGRAMAPLAQVAGLLTRLSQSRQALLQLDELMKKPVERPAGKHFISKPDIRGQVELRDVVFQYPGQSIPALNQLNFTVEPGEHVGLIGAVGSGKTTIERLLLNLYQPDSGSVMLDGTDVRQIDPGDLRRAVGAVQQSPQLFYGSVRENITMGHETAPERAVLRAAEMAGVMEFLKESQAGLDTQVGERGEALSGGQRQAVAVARALLYDPPVLVLDEPTASMDPASENRLRLRLEKLIEGKTTLLITHKGAMLTLVDKLILIDRGRLVAFGPKDEVIRKLQGRQYGAQAENTGA
jgi:ATP-binding cassette subfamily C protein LapB